MLGNDFKKADRKDIQALVQKIERSDYSPWTKYDFKVTIKKLYKWLRKTEEAPEGVKWIKASFRNASRKLPEELFTEEEIRQLIDAAAHPRDKALIAALWESGCRVGELCTLRLKHIHIDKFGTQLIVDGKTGMRRVRIIAFSPLLATWLNMHPDRENPEAPLWVGIGTVNSGKAPKSAIKVSQLSV